MAPPIRENLKFHKMVEDAGPYKQCIMEKTAIENDFKIILSLNIPPERYEELK